MAGRCWSFLAQLSGKAHTQDREKWRKQKKTLAQYWDTTRHECIKNEIVTEMSTLIPGNLIRCSFLVFQLENVKVKLFRHRNIYAILVECGKSDGL